MFSVVSGSGYYSLVAMCGFLLAVASLDAEHGFPGARASVGADLGSVVAAYPLQSAGSVVVAHGLTAQWHVGFSRTRNIIGIPWIAKQIFNNWTTREALCEFK